MKKVPYYSTRIKHKDNSNKPVDINKTGMLEYLNNFDPYELKYSVLYDAIFYNAGINKNLESQNCKKTIPYNKMNDIIEFEKAFQFGNLTKETYSYISENLMLVYGSTEIVNDDIKCYHYTEKKIIQKYLAIPQLEQIFDEEYFNFEWDMHVGQNFSEHRNDYYRDHFIHQIRDMYSMLVLLGQHGFYEATLKILSDERVGKISKYTCKKLQEFQCKKDGAYPLLKEIYYPVKKNLENIFDELTELTSNEKEKYLSRCKDPSSYAKNYFLKYVIYASTMLSGLFHDMGYPICHFLEVRHRISEYNPTMNVFTHNSIGNFDKISSKLANSLLFTVVSQKEIKKSLEINKKGRYNHGAYSAIAFLLQFYNNGQIFSLSPEKQCAIEMAALAIYNHTLDYNITDYDPKNNYYQPLFRQNPISFMLRLCDDLQEWDRRYFEISKESDFPICSKCLLPSISINNNKDRNNDKNNTLYDPTTKNAEYFCCCENNKDKNSHYYMNSSRSVNFMNRKVYLITTADFMTSEIIEVINKNNQMLSRTTGKIRIKNSKADVRKTRVLHFRINYDLYRLLNIARINSTYAKFRLKELNEIKTLLNQPNFKFQSENELKFDYIYLNYFMTSNPIAIKVKILEKYLITQKLSSQKKVISTRNKENLTTDELLIEIQNATLDKIFTDLFGAAKMDSPLYKLLSRKDGVFDFYKNLLKICVIARKEGGTCSTKSIRRFIDKYTKEIPNKITKPNNIRNRDIQTSREPIYRDTMATLIYECFRQYSNEIVLDENGHIDESFIDDERYYSQYKPESKEAVDLLSNCVATYCNVKNDFNSYKQFDKNYKNSYIGYFADLHFFEMMNREIQNFYKSQLNQMKIIIKGRFKKRIKQRTNTAVKHK